MTQMNRGDWCILVTLLFIHPSLDCSQLIGCKTWSECLSHNSFVVFNIIDDGRLDYCTYCSVVSLSLSKFYLISTKHSLNLKSFYLIITTLV